MNPQLRCILAAVVEGLVIYAVVSTVIDVCAWNDDPERRRRTLRAQLARTSAELAALDARPIPYFSGGAAKA